MRYDVVVIGAGQAGLAMGRALTESGLGFALLDAGPEVGDSWRTRWDSLRLFTPARYSALPGLPFPGDPEHHPGKDAVADYLAEYARRFSLPVRPNETVRAVRAHDHGFEVETAAGRYLARQVVVATGPFQRPVLPPSSTQLDASVVQLHSADYRNPTQLPAGPTLVVGAGNSGVQIAEELARDRPVTLAVGGRMPRLPQTLLGRSIFWWLERAGLLSVTADSRLGRRMKRTETLIGGGPRQLARAGRVRLVGRVEHADGSRIDTRCGRVIAPSAVVWATGFRPDYSWLRLPALGPDGWPIQTRGASPIPGLYFLGLPWMHTRGSALIGWVGDDAAHLATLIRRADVSRPTRPALLTSA